MARALFSHTPSDVVKLLSIGETAKSHQVRESHAETVERVTEHTVLICMHIYVKKI